MRLTDIVIRSLKLPGKGAIIFSDDLIPGFGIRVSEGGTKSFVLTHGPRRERETLGRVGILSLQEARIEAKRRLAEYTLGKNRPRTASWNAAKDEYLTEKANDLKPRTQADYTYILNRHFKYGATKLCELSPHDLHKSLARLNQTPAEQQHAFVVVRAFLRWAHRKHYFDRNPIERMQAPHSYVPRERTLTSDELARVWNAAENDTFGKIVKLLILTGQRRGEITQLTGSMVGEATIILPSWLAKNGRQHVMPLGKTARMILGAPRPQDACFFPALGKTTPFNGFSKCKSKLEKRSGVTDWTLHDLRRTFASGLASIGVQLPVIERLLNHVSGSFSGIVGVYQRYDFFPEMQDAIERWETHVLKIGSALRESNIPNSCAVDAA
ncbi:MAG TPA: tyrosine-type recombinase/integrase [Rhizomicrobium sp.]|jgi:integrase|nr:tyrosine-type recombinase/integrase [Rhizomicrobium sp.]